MPGCQDARMPGCQDARMPGCQDARAKMRRYNIPCHIPRCNIQDRQDVTSVLQCRPDQCKQLGRVERGQDQNVDCRHVESCHFQC
ncbi:hypothetical protein B0H67DRAFT_571063 [Lasiosphaeris hirsuta]|uniref:Uncharacterized protein n=1 Tax=Lasiosphaeris hirsuta TaxID=260670 RepID=A0AA40B0X1_9PEZI|nr:hypothetical protein B0H67DRAFT_571063 [Lasiosphaeris hirsuta]